MLARVAPLAVTTRIAYGLGFMVFSALLIHQAHGMIEMHFAIFALLAFLLYYRDIWPIVAAAGLIAVHHLAFNFLQVSGAPVFVFEGRTGLGIVMVHAAFVVVETLVLVMIARQFERELRQSEALYDGLNRITADSQNIDLGVRVAADSSTLADHFNEFMTAIGAAVSNARDAAERQPAAMVRDDDADQAGLGEDVDLHQPGLLGLVLLPLHDGDALGRALARGVVVDPIGHHHHAAGRGHGEHLGDDAVVLADIGRLAPDPGAEAALRVGHQLLNSGLRFGGYVCDNLRFRGRFFSCGLRG